MTGFVINATHDPARGSWVEGADGHAAQHSVNGCGLHPGDLIGTGTISAPRA